MAANYLRSILNPREEEISFDSFLKFPEFLFRFYLFSFEPLSETATVKQKFVYILKVIYFCCNLVALGCAFAMIAAFGIINIGSYEALSTVPHANSILIVLLRSLSTLMNRKNIWKICQELKELHHDRVTTRDFTHNLKTFVDKYLLVIKAYATSFALATFALIFPLILFFIYGTTDLSVHYWFPFDAHGPAFFPLAAFWSIWITWNCSVQLLATDSLLYGLISAIVMEFEVLREDFSRLKQIPKEERMRNIPVLIDRHNKLLDFVDKLQNIYSVTFLYCFVNSSIIACFLLFQMATATTIKEGYMLNAPVLLVMAGQIYFLCYFGQKIIDSSLSVADGAYDCGWEDIEDITAKKMIIPIMGRSQRSKKLTAMKFGDISLINYTAILASTGSYFTILQNIYS